MLGIVGTVPDADLGLLHGPARLEGGRVTVAGRELDVQRGTEALPPHCPGHIGYAVVPWKRRRGYATAALRAIMPEASAEGLAWVEITTDPDNVASRRVIEANGGVLVERTTRPPQLGGTPALRYRIDLAPRA